MLYEHLTLNPLYTFLIYTRLSTTQRALRQTEHETGHFYLQETEISSYFAGVFSPTFYMVSQQKSNFISVFVVEHTANTGYRSVNCNTLTMVIFSVV